MTDALRSLSAVPIAELLDAANDRLKHATIDDLATLFDDSSPRAGSAERLAEMILALPGKGSKLAAAEDATVLLAFRSADGNVSAAARLLGLDRKSYYRKLAGAKRRAK